MTGKCWDAGISTFLAKMLGNAGIRTFEEKLAGKCWDLGFSPKKLTNKLTTFYKICTFFRQLWNFVSSIFLYFFFYFFPNIFSSMVWNFLNFFSSIHHLLSDFFSVNFFLPLYVKCTAQNATLACGRKLSYNITPNPAIWSMDDT